MRLQLSREDSSGRFATSGVALAALRTVSTALVAAAAAASCGPHGRTNELTLWGLEPGRATRAAAFSRVRAQQWSQQGTILAWREPCTNRQVRLEMSGDKVVQSITISAPATVPGHEDCRSAGATLPAGLWRTGEGLALGDSRDRILSLYGPPGSKRPSMRGDAELESYYYSFEWAGSDVPQVMEVACEPKGGRVVQITLAYPAL